jgi:hypothetical protein
MESWMIILAYGFAKWIGMPPKFDMPFQVENLMNQYES